VKGYAAIRCGGVALEQKQVKRAVHPEALGSAVLGMVSHKLNSSRVPAVEADIALPDPTVGDDAVIAGPEENALLG
jgi:hypothetical protein